MYEKKFKISAPTVFLDISDLISRNCKPGENIKIELPLKGCAESQAAWQAEYSRLIHKMESVPKIHVSVNQSLNDFIIVRTDTEVAAMNREIIKNLVKRMSPTELINKWLPNGPSADAVTSVAQAGSTEAPNILYSCITDYLVSLNLRIRSLNAGNQATSNYSGISIWAQTQDAADFLHEYSSFRQILEAGIKKLITEDTQKQWPLLKATSNISITMHLEKHPSKESCTDFFIDLGWSHNTKTTSPSRLQLVPQQSAATVPSTNKRRLQDTLTLTVESGGVSTVHTINEVPCRISRFEETSDITLADCQYVSGKNVHLFIDMIDGDLVVVDRASTNGTFTADGRDIRKMPDGKYRIPPHSSTELFLCGQFKRDSKDYPRLVIQYGGTPELGEIDGTPELEDEFEEDVVNF